MTVADLSGAAGGEGFVDAQCRSARQRRGRERRIDQRKSEFAEDLLADQIRRSDAEGIRAVVARVGTLLEVEIADTEIAAVVLPALVLGLDLVAAADQVLDAGTEVHGIDWRLRQAGDWRAGWRERVDGARIIGTIAVERHGQSSAALGDWPLEIHHVA